MTFADLIQELSDRGFSHLDATRRGRYINAARAELDRFALWPWREAFATGTAPLAISDLAGASSIEAVINTSQSSVPLARSDWRSLLDMYGDLSTAGTPSFYYVASPAGTFEVATVPTSSDTIGVQYWRVTPDLTGTQSPASPDEAHYTIVDLAVRRAYRDSDNHGAAEALQPEIDRALNELLVAYPPGTADGPDAYVGVTYASEDW